MIRISEHYALDLLLVALYRPHRLVTALFWRLIGRRVRARGRLASAIATLPFAVERRTARKGKADRAAIRLAREQKRSPRLCVHLHIAADDPAAVVERAAIAISRQSVEPECVILTYEEGALEASLPKAFLRLDRVEVSSHIQGLQIALEASRSKGLDWVVPSQPPNCLMRHAVAGFSAYLIGLAVGASPCLIYGDEAETQGRFSPSRFWLKPQFDARMYQSQDYVTRTCALRVGPALLAFESADSKGIGSLYHLVLLMSQAGAIDHINSVISNQPSAHWMSGTFAQLPSLERELASRAEVSPGPFGTVRTRWALGDSLPAVSVIVATRDRVDLLRNCVEGVLEATHYPALDLIIADNESVEPETLSYMEDVSADPRVTVVRWPHRFNYSAINNFAARHAKGDYLCFLNNDIEVIDPDWLTEMIREAVQPGVGAVGARLLYPDRSIQHAGVAIGIGNAAGHAHRDLPEGEPGYYAQALIARGASAVTGACLLIARKHFEMVNGLDETKFAVAYNDVDLCLRLREKGFCNIYTPHAILIHHESKSRGSDFSPENLERYLAELSNFQSRWDTEHLVDPWHHALLDRNSERYRVG